MNKLDMIEFLMDLGKALWKLWKNGIKESLADGFQARTDPGAWFHAVGDRYTEIYDLCKEAMESGEPDKAKALEARLEPIARVVTTGRG